MDGDDYGDDAATAWWAQSDDNNNLAGGDWGLDPAVTVVRQLTFAEPVEATYSFNPFFGRGRMNSILLEATVFVDPREKRALADRRHLR